jgi:divalent metal cation (Fe/Co/Zn/Cd) transporter
MTGINQEEIVRLVRKGRRSEDRADAISGCITAMMVAAVLFVINGFIVYSAINAVHNHWLPQVPAIGYGTALLVTIAVRTLFAVTTPAAKAKP